MIPPFIGTFCCIILPVDQGSKPTLQYFSPQCLLAETTSTNVAPVHSGLGQAMVSQRGRVWSHLHPWNGLWRCPHSYPRLAPLPDGPIGIATWKTCTASLFFVPSNLTMRVSLHSLHQLSYPSNETFTKGLGLKLVVGSGGFVSSIGHSSSKTSCSTYSGSTSKSPKNAWEPMTMSLYIIHAGFEACRSFSLTSIFSPSFVIMGYLHDLICLLTLRHLDFLYAPFTLVFLLPRHCSRVGTRENHTKYF